MNEFQGSSQTGGDDDRSEDIDPICAAFEEAWRAGESPRIEEYLPRGNPARRGQLLRELIILDVQRHEMAGKVAPSREQYRGRFPDQVEAVEQAFAELVDQAEGSETLTHNPPGTGDGAAVRPVEEVAIPENSLFQDRYRVERELGRGQFGVVYRAHDTHLDRDVALKWITGTEATRWDLDEARMAARLDHPAVVPVYDVGSTPENHCYIVSKYIEGCSLKELLAAKRPTIAQSVSIVAQIAQALHAAHKAGVVHRDVKPANILIDHSGLAYLTDFGLAVCYENLGSGPELAGSPTYMSPEQARGASHLVDGRSDVFSLGIVLYEMVVGRVPFAGPSRKETLSRIEKTEPWPPRMVDDSIPQQLEVICLKALSKSMNLRYTTARDMADELTKCCTYEPRPIDTSGVSLPATLEQLIEELSRNNHDVWASRRLAEGWQYGDVRSDERKMHPDLVPYEMLTESEKEYDRQTVLSTLKSIVSLGYEIRRKTD